MNLKGIPKKYHESILDFYKDEDGWWICLKEDGDYILDSGYAFYTVHEDTKKDAIAEFRACITRKEA